jgi:type II secretory pathway pseudopilin PulG
MKLITKSSRSTRAFTMVEIALSLAVVAFALVAIIGVLPSGLNVQRDNREDTIITQDAVFLAESLRSGSTNLLTLCSNVDLVEFKVYAPNAPAVTNYYSNLPPAQLIGLLTQPYRNPPVPPVPAGQPVPPPNPNTYSVRFKMRSINGPQSDRGKSQATRDFAFTYWVTPQIVAFDANNFAYNVDDTVFNTNLVTTNDIYHKQYFEHVKQRDFNLFDLTLTFEWPVFPDFGNPMGRVGNGRQEFRTMIAGALVNDSGNIRFKPNLFEARP